MQEQYGTSEPNFIRRTVIVLTLAALLFLTWHMFSLLLLIFGAVLVAVIFRAVADPIRGLVEAPDGVAVGIAVMLILGNLGLATWMFGSEVSAQVRTSPTCGWCSPCKSIDGQKRQRSGDGRDKSASFARRLAL